MNNYDLPNSFLFHFIRISTNYLPRITLIIRYSSAKIDGWIVTFLAIINSVLKRQMMMDRLSLFSFNFSFLPPVQAFLCPDTKIARTLEANESDRAKPVSRSPVQK